MTMQNQHAMFMRVAFQVTVRARFKMKVAHMEIIRSFIRSNEDLAGYAFKFFTVFPDFYIVPMKIVNLALRIYE